MSEPTNREKSEGCCGTVPRSPAVNDDATTPLLDLNTPALDAALAAMVLAIHDYDAASWRTHALCRQYPELAWHEALEKLKLRRRELEELRSICARCPVRQPCDDWSSGLKAMPGVVAGRTRGERFALRRITTSTPATTEPTTATEPATKD